MWQPDDPDIFTNDLGSKLCVAVFQQPCLFNAFNIHIKFQLC